MGRLVEIEIMDRVVIAGEEYDGVGQGAAGRVLLQVYARLVNELDKGEAVGNIEMVEEDFVSMGRNI